MPLIRYRSSDVTRLVDGRCACGISMGRLAKIRSRCDEMVVCGMGNVGAWVFDEIVRGTDGVGADWQAAIGHDGRRDVVTLHVELDDPSLLPRVEEQLASHMRERFADFARNRDLHLYEWSVAAHAPGSLRGDRRKLRRVVDQRPMTATV